MNLHVRKMRAQSAMEYLMTYGWAILIIAVVLGVFFTMGVFKTSSLMSTTCMPLSGYFCENPVLSTSGVLTLTIGQATDTTYSNVVAYIVPTGSTLNSTDPSNSIGTLNPDQTVTVTFSNLPGIGSSPSIGTIFTGQVWLVFSTGSGYNLETQIATLTVKVT